MKNDQFSTNKIYYNKRLDQIVIGNTVLPTVLEVSLSGICNQNCYYCCCNEYKVDKQLDRSQIDSLILQIEDIIQAINITGGGEPLLNPLYCYFIEQAFGKKISIGLTTNGQAFDHSNIIETVKYLKFCRISIDSVDDQTYRTIRGQNANLEKVLENLELLVVNKMRFNSTILIGAQIVLDIQTIEDIEYSIKTLSNIGVDFIQIRPIDYRHNHKNSDYKYDIIINRLQEIRNRNDKVIISHKFKELMLGLNCKKYNHCLGGNLTCAIGHDNHVYFCCANIGNKRYDLGDLSNKKFVEIMMSDKRKSLIYKENHDDCLLQCRNHVINNEINNLMMIKDELELTEFIKMHQTGYPIHCEFL